VNRVTDKHRFLLALGISHKTAHLALRERLALTSHSAKQLLCELTSEASVEEAVALSTCNRTEIYVATNNLEQAHSLILAKLTAKAELSPSDIEPSLYTLHNCATAHHLFRVTSGLEAMVLGECEIQGQVRQAYELARTGGFTGPVTNRLFHAALATGKRVRAGTQIAAHRRSVASVAASFAKQALGGKLTDCSALVLGVGNMGEQVACALARAGATTIFTTNRRRERSIELAQRLGGRTVGFDQLPLELQTADIVIGATSSPHALVEPDELATVMQARNQRPLLLLDIAVPRDFDPACGEIAGVTLHDIDDLKAALTDILASQTSEVSSAQQIVDGELQRFSSWLGSLAALPTVGALHQRAQTIIETVIAENADRWESASSRDLQLMETVARAIVKRLLHEPTTRLKQLGDERTHVRAEVLRELFALEDVEEASQPQRPPASVHALARMRK
jgi:glutamyl-tRNA reductase